MSGPTDFREDTSISQIDPANGMGDIGTGGEVDGILGFPIDDGGVDPTDGQIIAFEQSSLTWKLKDQQTGAKTIYNNTGADLEQFSVVVVDKTRDEAVTTTTTPQFIDGKIGVCLARIPVASSGPVQFVGYVPGMLVTSAVVRGSFAETSTTAGKATSSAFRHKGSFAQFLQGLDSSGGIVRNSGILLGTSATALSVAGTTMNFNVPTVDDGTGTGTFVTVPDGVVMLLALYLGGGSSSPAITGWTRIGSTSGFRYYYRISSSEPTTYAVTWTGSSQAIALVAAIDGLDTSGPVAGFAYDATTAAAVISGLAAGTYYSIAAVDNRVAQPPGWAPVVDGASFSGTVTPADVVQVAHGRNDGFGVFFFDFANPITPGNQLLMFGVKVDADSSHIFVNGGGSSLPRPFDYRAIVDQVSAGHDNLIAATRTASGDEQHLALYSAQCMATIYEISNAADPSTWSYISADLQAASGTKTVGTLPAGSGLQIMSIEWGPNSGDVYLDQTVGTGWSQDVQDGRPSGLTVNHPAYLAARATTNPAASCSGPSYVWAGIAVGVVTANPVVQGELVTQTFTGTGITSPFSGSSAQNDAILAFNVRKQPFQAATPVSAILFGQPDKDDAGGPMGPEGPEGPEGPSGPPGQIGATGATGPQGPAGSGSGGGAAAMPMPDNDPQDIISEVMGLINPRDRVAIQEVTSGKAYDAERLIFDDNTTSDAGSGAVRVRGLASGTIGCRLTKSGTQSTTNLAEPAVSFDGEDFDTDNFHDNVTSNSRITVPAGLAGKYLLIGMVTWAANATGYRYLRFKKNGTSFSTEITQITKVADGTNENAYQVTAIMALAATDYVELTAGQASGGNLNIDAASFSAIKLDSGRVGTGVGASAHNNGVAQAIANASIVALSWSTNIFDTDGFHAAGATTKFTCPAGMGGKYFVSGNVALAASSATGNRWVAVRVNGTDYYGINNFDPQTTIGEQYGSTSAVVVLAATDYVEIVVRQDSGGSVSTAAQTYASRGQIMRLDSLPAGGGYSEGTAFPSGPVLNQKFYRTDLNMLFYYDGTRWLCTCPHNFTVSQQRAVDPVAGTTTIAEMVLPALTANIFITHLYFATYVATTNSGVSYWTISAGGYSVNTSADTHDIISTKTVTAGANQSTAGTWIQVDITKTGSPGPIYTNVMVEFRYTTT